MTNIRRGYESIPDLTPPVRQYLNRVQCLDMINAANDAARDALVAAPVNGAIAVDSLGSAGTFKLWVRTNGVWKSVAIA